MTAVPADGQVTLYWDDIAENSFDRYISKIGEMGVTSRVIECTE